MKYKVLGYMTVSCWTEVEAETEHDAKNIARSRPVAEVIISGSYDESEFWQIDNDGVPVDIYIGD